jgi:hypothetical protein
VGRERAMGPPSLSQNRQHGDDPLGDRGERSVSRALTTPAIPATTRPALATGRRRPSVPLGAMATPKLLTQLSLRHTHRLRCVTVRQHIRRGRTSAPISAGRLHFACPRIVEPSLANATWVAGDRRLNEEPRLVQGLPLMRPAEPIASYLTGALTTRYSFPRLPPS